ncbi:MAG: hypothetical protein EBU90_24935 [Proteobacteria bacterium]|nr:hypothetical protein [Pseudomonadota bacterium]
MNPRYKYFPLSGPAVQVYPDRPIPIKNAFSINPALKDTDDILTIIVDVLVGVGVGVGVGEAVAVGGTGVDVLVGVGVGDLVGVGEAVAVGGTGVDVLVGVGVGDLVGVGVGVEVEVAVGVGVGLIVIIDPLFQPVRGKTYLNELPGPVYVSTISYLLLTMVRSGSQYVVNFTTFHDPGTTPMPSL